MISGTTADGGGKPERKAAGGQDQLPLRPLESARGAVEAVLVVATDPVPVERLAAGLGAPVEEVLEHLHALRAEYDATGRGLALRDVAGGWRLYAAERFATELSAFLLEGHHARMSTAALETLAVVAYRQPVSRARIAAVRGVAVDGVVRTLLARGLIQEAGLDEASGGTLLATTEEFLRRLGVQDLSELPPLAELLPDIATIEQTSAQPLTSG